MILIIFLRISCQIGTFNAVHTCAYVLREELRAEPFASPLAVQPFNEKGNCKKWKAMF